MVVQSLNVIILWSFNKIKSKGFMVYSNDLVCLLFRKKKFTKIFLGDYLKYIDLVVARPDLFQWTNFSLKFR